MPADQQDDVGARKTSSLVIAGRLILLLLAVAATVSGFVLSRERYRGASGSGGRYVCPMHAEVTSSIPGECSICRMALEPVRPSSGGGSAIATGPALSLAESEDLQDHKIMGTVTRRVFTLEVRAPAWIDTAGVVTAVLYTHDLTGLSPGERGLFFRAASPTVGVDVRLTADPPAPEDGSTSRVHFRLASAAPELGPGRVVKALGGHVEVGWVKLAAKSRDLLVVPSSAVLYSSEGPYVLVPAGDGRDFSKRRVEIGRVYRGVVVVLSGLSEQEPLVTANTFFLDAERRLRSQREETAAVMP
jgi:heavy metal-binding protein